MLTSVKKSKSGEDIDIGGSQIQQEKIAFLENNLDRLTKVHKDVSITLLNLLESTVAVYSLTDIFNLTNQLDLFQIHSNTQLVTDHSELEREKPKLEKKVQMLEDQINALEQKLRESEKERHRYQNEANRIKEMMQKNVMSTRHAAQIGKCFVGVLRLQRSISK